MGYQSEKVKKIKLYKVTFYSRYYRFDTRVKLVKGISKSDIRSRWHEIMLTDEYIIKSIEEVN